ncbi:hypothetical protein H9P43_004194 [Blastocladiella emersonii ATCC 22665]|nr:hypothetical protein H9P43_004194 [Blastocladiella emersonii ATCC 22665]
MGHSHRPCVFCAVNHDDFRIEYMDDEIAIFHDRSPSAVFHLQAVPRAHIKNINALDASHLPLLRNLESHARAVLAQPSFQAEFKPNSKIYLGFHIPPLNSVHHLHMHVLVTPFKFTRKFKYTTDVWLMPLAKLVARLEAGQAATDAGAE